MRTDAGWQLTISTSVSLTISREVTAEAVTFSRDLTPRARRGRPVDSAFDDPRGRVLLRS